MCGVAVHTS